MASGCVNLTQRIVFRLLIHTPFALRAPQSAAMTHKPQNALISAQNTENRQYSAGSSRSIAILCLSGAKLLPKGGSLAKQAPKARDRHNRRALITAQNAAIRNLTLAQTNRDRFPQLY